MRINKNSWHYKLHSEFYDWYIPNNLCKYFWKTVLGIFLALLLLAVSPILLIAWLAIKTIEKLEQRSEKVRVEERVELQQGKIRFRVKVKQFFATYFNHFALLFYVALFGVWFSFFHNDFFYEGPAWGILTLSFIFAFLLSIVCFFVIAFIIGGDELKRIDKFVEDYGKPIERKDWGDNLFFAYLKSFKDKVCPLIDFVDE